MLPLPPLSRFSPSRVYAGHNFFPLADQLLLVPRRFAQTVFEAIRLCYDCKALQAQSELGVPAQTESLLRMVLRGEDGSDDIVPFGYYEFPVVIVRSNEGGVCEVLHPHKISCEMLRAAGYMADPTASTEVGDDQLGGFRCPAVMQRWYRQACVEMFPPLDLGTGYGDGAGESGRSFIDGERTDAELQRMAIADRLRSEPSSEPSRDEVVTFEEATGRVEGIHQGLHDLLATMRVDVAPTHKPSSYFLAHHYPFHRVDPLRRAERGLLDEIAVIEGVRISKADINRLVLAFSCFLAGATTVERGHEVGGRAPEPPGQGGAQQVDDGDKDDIILVLKTTAAEEEGLIASVNCSLVESLHDVWGVLLENKFEPSETICRGPIGPCLERAMAEDRDLGTTK